MLKEPFQNRLEPDEEGYPGSDASAFSNASTLGGNKGQIDGVGLLPSPSSNNRSPSGETSYDVDEVKESGVPGWKVTPKSAAGVHGASTVDTNEGQFAFDLHQALFVHD